MEISTYNLDDELIRLTHRDRLPRLAVYCIDKVSVVLGRGSKPETEINTDLCREDGVPVYRRHGGGCAVVLDPENIIISLVLPSKRYGKINDYFELITTWIIQGLAQCGVGGVYREGVSDLVIGDRKIAGSSMQKKPDLVYYTASLLIDPDIDLMERYLKHPPKEPAYRRLRPHAEFVGSLRLFSGVSSTTGFRDELKRRLRLEDLVEIDNSLSRLIVECFDGELPGVFPES